MRTNKEKKTKSLLSWKKKKTKLEVGSLFLWIGIYLCGLKKKKKSLEKDRRTGPNAFMTGYFVAQIAVYEWRISKKGSHIFKKPGWAVRI